MTPQLQQAIRLLQLSSLDLSQEIQQALYENPMLEYTDESDRHAAPTASTKEINSASEQPSASDKAPTDQNHDVSDTNLQQEIPNDLNVDANWDDIYPTAPISHAKNPEDDRDFESVHSVTESLQDHLMWQLQLTNLSAVDKIIAEHIIDAVDTRGMLSTTPQDIWAALDNDDIELDEVIAVLHHVQQFDPPGVAATSIEECLSIQLQQFSPDTPHLALAKDIAQKHLPLVAPKEMTKLKRLTGESPASIEDAILLIQSLSPYPGDAISSEATEYVIPDVRVSKVNDQWQIGLNNDVTPKININQQYASMIRRADNSDANTYLKNHLQEAKWLLRSIESRNETLMKVATCIVHKQQEFLEQGPIAMKPMVLADIAEQLEMHESTISRVTTQKYMDTPQGIFELKYFFSSHVSTESGGECSSTAIRAMLKEMISAENTSKPLSDNKLTKLLQDMGIQVARRTVAKYREGMGIPSSSERKR